MNNPFANMQGIMQRFQQFQQTFKGDANQQIQQMMNSGKINQTQYNQAVQMAQQFRKMFGRS
jgi:hypothetical protein